MRNADADLQCGRILVSGCSRKNYVFINILVSFTVLLWRPQSRRKPTPRRLKPTCKKPPAMNRSAISFASAALIAATMAVSNEARAHDGDLAAGLFGGLIAGAIVGSAVAPRAPEPVYVAPEPYYAPPPYYPEPVCFGRQQVYDSYYRVVRWQRVRVPCY
jgi:hypothetical protein